MDKKRFLINLISNFLSALSGVGITFFLTPYIVSALGKESYGFFSLSNNFIMYAGILTTALNSMSARFITISLEQKDLKQVNVYFNSVLVGNFLISIFFFIVGGLCCLFLDRILDIPIPLVTDVKLLFAFMFIGLITNISTTAFSALAFAVNRLDKLAINNIIINMIRLVGIIALFYFFVPKIYFLGVVTVFTSFYFGFANYRFSKKIMPEVRINFKDFSTAALVVMLSSGVWNSVGALSNVVNSQIDLLIANKLFDASAMGLLSLTKLAPNALQLLLGIIVPVFLPEMIKAYAKNEKEKLLDILNFSFKLIFLILMIPMAIFYIYGTEFYQLWLPDQDFKALYIISILTLTPMIVHGCIETVYHVFVVTNKLKLLSIWGIFISILNFTTVIVLYKNTDLGIYSIPAAGFIVGLLNHLTFTPIYAAKYLNLDLGFFYKKLLFGLLCFVILLAVSYGWKMLHLFEIDSWLRFLLNTILLGMILLAIAIGLRFDKATRNKAINLVKAKINSVNK
ncbi:lipopolysaccharide biosynthesis protein [Sphingobacterium sp. BN32]|uniref:lipopolysaccharide biosynthesis protein n=1 Tax=Sphingobacterium sp. BN32 TaxID=3058432 RepID=UPI00265CB542|nr:hypothetical protein [Sphingobacterium sp. BN32]WKK59777.1 hypothetical protein QYC40_05945 [Sphingobacterium sp. BN32]